ncbi:defective in cullin neddylation 1 domain containing SCCRO3 isoform X1 [Tachypleus tridentatus]|uniref:defective in cullin neddylation 1 domain containing SCCRO3 isoform X1 n=1 Tax=Tachypleus tridentatus TaxID=6853 RepID=UPI003FD27399
MGKCLSCCQSNQAGSVPEKHLKHQESSRTVEFSGASVPSNNCGGSQILRSSNRELSAPVVSSNGEMHISTSSKSTLGFAEKLMFHPRIPPIRSGSTDKKRSSHSGRDYSESKIHALFDQYKDSHEDAILSEGIERLCQDLEVKPEEFRVLVLAWKFGAEQMCCFTHEEFVIGCKALHVDTVQGIRSKFPEMLAEVQNPEKFKDLYRFTYRFGLEVGQRILPAEMAIQLWKLIFSIKEPSILKRWLVFLEKHPNIRGIPRDTWNMFLNFTETVGDDLSCYDDTEAWPSLFDDFVEYENDQTNQNVLQSKEIEELE